MPLCLHRFAIQAEGIALRSRCARGAVAVRGEGPQTKPEKGLDGGPRLRARPCCYDAGVSLRRPRSLSGLLLIGFTLVTVPLLIAVVNATIEMRHLTQQSELLVRHGIQATRHAQELFRHTASLERTARLYEVLGDQTLKGVLADHHRDYQVTLESLRKLVADPATVLKLSELAAAGSELAGAIERDDPKDPALHTLIESFGRQNEKVEMVANQTTADIYGELKRLQENASRTQTELFWQAAALVPVTAFILMVFVSLLVRPPSAWGRRTPGPYGLESQPCFELARNAT